MDYKKIIAQKLNVEGFTEDEVSSFLEVPPTNELGDYALPCFRFSKVLHKAPALIADELKAAFPLGDGISEVSAVNGYLNFRVDRNAYAKNLLTEILKKGDRYGAQTVGNGKTVCIEYSSVNIAKPFHIGHLSTTVLGSSLCKIYRFMGYNVVAINHLGDYGTQFGKLIVAYKKWSSEEAVKEGRLKELNRIYVKFHEEAEKDPSLDDEARAVFKRIETGDKEASELFELFKRITLEEVEKVYRALNVSFDSYKGESFYIDKMQPIVDELESKGLLKESDGAKVVDLEAYNMPPCLVLKADGSSLYATRDLAAAEYRKKTYDFYKSLYVVAYQQNLHFQQFFKVLELLGREWAKDLVHVAYGMVSLADGAMSTRKGKVVLLEDVLSQAVEKAKAVILEKNFAVENIDDTANKIGRGAVIFGALQNNKIKDIVFSIDKVLNFEGETCPYVLYTVARAGSVLEKAGGFCEESVENVPELQKEEYDLVATLGRFSAEVAAASEKYEPSIVTRYALDLAAAYNRFYLNCKVLTATEPVKSFRLALTKATKTVLTSALALLGIDTVERM